MGTPNYNFFTDEPLDKDKEKNIIDSMTEQFGTNPTSNIMRIDDELHKHVSMIQQTSGTNAIIVDNFDFFDGELIRIRLNGDGSNYPMNLYSLSFLESHSYTWRDVPVSDSVGNTNIKFMPGTWCTFIYSEKLEQWIIQNTPTPLADKIVRFNSSGIWLGYLDNMINPNNMDNIMIGSRTFGEYDGSSSSNNIIIGMNGMYLTGINNSIGIGSVEIYSDINNFIAIGHNSVASASNQITLGNNQITQLRCQVSTISSLSDERIKEDIQPADINLCLEAVNSLPVTRYKYKDFTGAHLDKHVTGWMADDVSKVFPKAVTKTDEWYPILDENGEIVYEDVVRTKKEIDETGKEIEVEYTEKQPKKFLLEDVKSITMTEAVPTLWGAVQALTKQVKELQELVSKNNT